MRGRPLGRRLLGQVATLFSPETILGWYRKLVAAKYDGSKKRGPGRPSTRAEIQKLVLRVAKENPRWGYTRIQGALKNVGHEVGRTTVKEILVENGLDPAPLQGGGADPGSPLGRGSRPHGLRSFVAGPRVRRGNLVIRETAGGRP